MKQLQKPAINMHCIVCRSIQTFNMINNYGESLNVGDNSGIWGETVRAVYRCSACYENKSLHIFLIEFTKTHEDKNKQGNTIEIGYMQKVGQKPPWSIKMEKILKRF